MIPKAWIFFAFCFASCVTFSQGDSDACTTAKAEYAASRMVLFHAFDLNLTAIFDQIAKRNSSHDAAEAQQAVDILNRHLGLFAQAVENAINQCAPIAGRCPKIQLQYFYSADVFRAAAKFWENVKIEEYMEHIRTLIPCQVTRHNAGHEVWPRILELSEKDCFAAGENSTASCGFVCGRKCACRAVQVAVLYETTRPTTHIRDVCGQKAYEMLLELLDRAMNALNCSEFGDYVREWGWLKINYRANHTSPVTHH